MNAVMQPIMTGERVAVSHGTQPTQAGKTGLVAAAALAAVRPSPALGAAGGVPKIGSGTGLPTREPLCPSGVR
jgi:hypothetical protein